MFVSPGDPWLPAGSGEGSHQLGVRVPHTRGAAPRLLLAAGVVVETDEMSL